MVPCTIVIPTHNRDDLLPRAVRSALEACPVDGEVLVVDDKSAITAERVLSNVPDRRLRVVVNGGPSGAASTRNLGVESALGQVVFFLDDDDEMCPDYCQRVLRAVGPSLRAGWGFSSTLERRGAADDTLRTRRRLRQGAVPSKAGVRDQMAAMSDGFWIGRTLYQQMGGLDPAQSIDEDTDLCARLLAAGHRPWYEPKPGMIVYRGYTPARPHGAQLTVATSAQRGLDCYRRTFEKNAGQVGAAWAVRWFLATRYLRRAVKAGQAAQALRFARQQKPWYLARALVLFIRVKQVAHS